MTAPTTAAPTASPASRPRFRIGWYGWTGLVLGLGALAGSAACGWSVASVIVTAVGLGAALVATFAAIGRICNT